MRLSSLILSATLLACGGSKKPLDTADPKKDESTEDSAHDSDDTNSTASDSGSGNEDSQGDTSTEPQAGPEAKANFSLTDVNASSPRSQEAVSPRDYLRKVSGWYFTHAT